MEILAPLAVILCAMVLLGFVYHKLVDWQVKKEQEKRKRAENQTRYMDRR